MKRLTGPIVATLVLTLAAIACGSGDGSEESKPDTNPRGGTLKVAIPQDFSIIGTLEPDFPPLDPQFEYSYDSWEIFRCCLLRTLLSYTGRETAEGGAKLQPGSRGAHPRRVRGRPDVDLQDPAAASATARRWRTSR